MCQLWVLIGIMDWCSDSLLGTSHGWNFLWLISIIYFDIYRKSSTLGWYLHFSSFVVISIESPISRLFLQQFSISIAIQFLLTSLLQKFLFVQFWGRLFPEVLKAGKRVFLHLPIRHWAGKPNVPDHDTLTMDHFHHVLLSMSFMTVCTAFSAIPLDCGWYGLGVWRSVW